MQKRVEVIERRRMELENKKKQLIQKLHDKMRGND